MDGFLQAAALVLIGVILSQAVGQQSKSFAVILSMGICIMLLLVGISYLKPVVDFLEELQALGNLQGEMVTILLKTTLICVITEIAALLCTDGGNASYAHALRLLSSGVILYLSIPAFRALLALVHGILEGV